MYKQLQIMFSYNSDQIELVETDMDTDEERHEALKFKNISDKDGNGLLFNLDGDLWFYDNFMAFYPRGFNTLEELKEHMNSEYKLKLTPKGETKNERW